MSENKHEGSAELAQVVKLPGRARVKNISEFLCKMVGNLGVWWLPDYCCCLLC